MLEISDKKKYNTATLTWRACLTPLQKIFLESEIFFCLKYFLTMSGLWQDIPVAEARPHPDYNLTARGLAVNDLMLLRLARPALFNQFVLCGTGMPSFYTRLTHYSQWIRDNL